MQRRLSLRNKAGHNESTHEAGGSMKNLAVPSDMHRVEVNDSNLISAMLNEEESAKVVSTFFAAKADLNRSGMVEYGLKDNEKHADKEKNTQSNLNVDFKEIFDSRGKKIRIKTGKIAHPPLSKLGYSFAVVNFHP